MNYYEQVERWAKSDMRHIDGTEKFIWLWFSSVASGIIVCTVAAILFLLTACADPNAGKFAPGKSAMLLGLREALELGVHIP